MSGSPAGKEIGGSLLATDMVLLSLFKHDSVPNPMFLKK